MQVLITVPDDKQYGVAHARGLRNANAAPEDQIGTDEGYVTAIINSAVESWCVAANLANVPPPAPPPPGVIDGVVQSVTRKQARAALILTGRLALVQPALDAITDDLQRQLAQNAWDEALTFERTDTFVLSIGTAIGLTHQELDDLFNYAATL